MSVKNNNLHGITMDIRRGRADNLHLNVYAKWFALLASGDKTEDYRDMSAYWHRRLYGRAYKTVTIRNGFGPFAPEAKFEFVGVDIGTGRPEWGAPGTRTVFIIRLGRKISSSNC